MNQIQRAEPSGRQYSRREFLKRTAGAIAAVSLYACGSMRRDTDRPNILYLFPDQWRAQALGCMGNPDVQTPHLDQVASEGLLLRNTLANTPVCCPARANMMTGQYASTNGMVANDLRLRESELTVAEVLQSAGYETGFIGKWHLDGGRRLPGFIPPGPRRQGFEFWAANQCSHRHFHNHYFRDTDQPIQFDTFEPEGWTDVAIDFLQKPHDRPFFLTIAMGPPHNPYGAPEKYMQMYDPAKLTMRPNWAAGARLGSREDIAAYYAAITAIDDQVGRLMQTLDEQNLADNTIVLISSDHGSMLGSQGTYLKRKPWEESIRVPGIVRYPAKVQAGNTSDALFSHVDFAPTLLSLCGVPVPTGMQGQDLSGVILGTDDGPDSAFFQIFGPYHGGDIRAGWRGVRTHRYMYARYQDRPWVLYDLDADPYEQNNLAGTAEAADIQQTMETLLTEWMQKTGDSWAKDWTVPVEDKGRLYTHRKTFYSVQEYLEWAKANPDSTVS